MISFLLVILSIILLIVIVLTAIYYAKHLKIGEPVNKIIADLHKEPLPELLQGEVGFAFNGNIKICYELIKSDRANGEYVVLLHGLTQTMLAYPNYLIDDFVRAGYHVIRLDNRDSGMSSWIKDWEKGNKYTLEDMADDAMAVVNHLNVNQFHLLGKSMGGMIAQSLAIRYPARVKSLVSLMSSAYFHDPELTQVPRKFAMQFALVYIGYLLSSKQLNHQLKFHLSIEHILSGEDKGAINQKMILQKALFEIKQRRGFNKRAQKQHGYAIRKSGSRIEALKQLSTPTLVIHGSADPLVKLEHSEKKLTVIPNIESLFIDKMGHRIPKVYSTVVSNSTIQFLDKHKIERKEKSKLPLKSY